MWFVQRTLSKLSILRACVFLRFAALCAGTIWSYVAPIRLVCAPGPYNLAGTSLPSDTTVFTDCPFNPSF